MASVQSVLFRVFLKRAIRPRMATTTIQQMRWSMDRNARLARLPKRTAVEPVTAGVVPAEWIRTSGAHPECAILYLHGGGFVAGSIGSHRALAAWISLASTTPVLIINYRLAPEYPFPAGLEDCLTAYRWLLQEGYDPHSLIIAGDSAGGNLTLATLLGLQEAGDPLPAAAVCLSPATDLQGTGETLQTNAAVEILLDPEAGRSWILAYLKDSSPENPLISPLNGNLRGLSPILIQVGSDEILLSDATRFCERARAAGVDVTLEVWPGMWHVWHAFTPFLPEAQRAVRRIGEYIDQHLQVHRN